MFHLPFRYTVRNLRRRLLRSLATLTGIAVSVFAAVLMLALTRGLQQRVDASGEAANVLAISRQGQNILFSSITEDEVVELGTLPGVAKDAYGQPLIAPQIMHMATVTAVHAGRTVQAPIYVRGVTPRAYEVHRVLQVVEGRLPENGGELLAGRSAHIKLGLPPAALKPGATLQFENQEWTVSGVFDAGGSLLDSELWVAENELQNLLRRRTHTFVVIRLESPAAVPAAVERFHVTGAVERYFKGSGEQAYYREFGAALGWVLRLAYLMVFIITAAGALIGINTMYTAVLNRMREIATCRVLGFTRADLLWSFTLEALLLALAGGLLGCGAGRLLNDVPLSLSYGAFRLVVDARVLALGLGLSLLIGIVGGLLPAWKGLRLNDVEGLRRG